MISSAPLGFMSHVFMNYGNYPILVNLLAKHDVAGVIKLVVLSLAMVS